MFIAMFNGWYFFWIALAVGITLGLYFGFRKTSVTTQKTVLFTLLALGLLFHFLKAYIPPYSVDEARHLRDSWFVNICGANIALFPFFFFSKNKYIKDYMYYIGMISGLIALFYPQEPMAKVDQLAESWDIVRFYFHHWMLLAVPLLMLLWGHHQLSWKRILVAPVGLLLLMLFIILNQIFQSELGFIGLRGDDIHSIPYINNSLIWGPDGSISKLLDWACPDFFKTIPVGPHAGEPKYWPWFWLIVPCFVIVTPACFLISMIFDRKKFKEDILALKERVAGWRKGTH